MKEIVKLKQLLKDRIGSKKVIAAVFYSFNFDPHFFENYIMPVLVPDVPFTNNPVYNNILWRKVYKDNEVPAITVYCDQDAKSNQSAPLLNYNVCSVRMPPVGKNKGNFHPKNSFILIKGEGYNSPELIVITGSNNLTQNGWCDNRECISLLSFKNGEFYPRSLKDSFKNFIIQVGRKFNYELTFAEEMLLAFFKQVKYTEESGTNFYNSFNGSFIDFLDKGIFTRDKISKVEIISPYFKKDTSLLKKFIDNNIEVHIQAPFNREYCLLEKEIFDAYQLEGVVWFLQPDPSRNDHLKVYRFYGQKGMYTVIGSVNLTAPAWEGFNVDQKKVFNIESVLMFVEGNTSNSILGKPIGAQTIKFLSPSIKAENNFERFEAPEIQFTINWKTKTLSWFIDCKNLCYLDLPGLDLIDLKKKKLIKFGEMTDGESLLKALSKNSVITVHERADGNQHVHYYYPKQEGFELRPTDYKFSSNDILSVWDLLGDSDENLNAWFVSRLEACTDSDLNEDGVLDKSISESKSLINAMARHFYGLSKLQEFVEEEKKIRKKDSERTAHFNNIRYYLTIDNADTLIAYIKDLEEIYKSGSLLSIYYWLLLNIIITGFYGNKKLFKKIKALDEINSVELILSMKNQKEGVKMKIVQLEAKLTESQTEGVSLAKLNWALKSLQKEKHELS